MCAVHTHTMVKHTEYSPASQPAYESANSTGVQKVATPAFLHTYLAHSDRARPIGDLASEEGRME